MRRLDYLLFYVKIKLILFFCLRILFFKILCCKIIMKFKTKEQLLEQMKKDKACFECRKWCKEQSSLDDIL